MSSCCLLLSSLAAARRSSAFVATTTAQRRFGRRSCLDSSTMRIPCGSSPLVRLFASSSASDDDDTLSGGPKTTRRKTKKLKVAEKIRQQNLDRLAAAFDELAKKEGFDASQAYYADDQGFDDDFTDDDYDDVVQEDVVLDNGSLSSVGSDEDSVHHSIDDGISDEEMADLILETAEFDLRDFVDDDDPPTEVPVVAASEATSQVAREDIDDMEARIAAAQGDIIGMIDEAPPAAAAAYDDDDDEEQDIVTPAHLRELGFKREVNPFGRDETPRQEQFKLVTNAMTCSACGSDFQCDSDERPGYLPPEKYETQVKLSKLEEWQQLQDDEWTPDDEVEWLLNGQQQHDIDIDAMAEQMGIDLTELSKTKKTICKRCHGLQNFGRVSHTSLRPGWTKDPLLSQETFSELLKPIRQSNCVVVALVDLFDFAGSVLPQLDAICGGDNPVLLAANKADLLPQQMGPNRVEAWIRRELEYLGINSLHNVGSGAVRLVSCKSGQGVKGLLDKARSLADERGCTAIYLVGAANSGKSTLLNRILAMQREEYDKIMQIRNKKLRKRRAGNRNAAKGDVTTSPLPGTTLQFLKVDMGGGRHLFDTPGLLVPGTLTQLLTPEELKLVVPRKQVEPITFRVASGKCVLIGGLARIEVVGDNTKPFFLTFYVANDIKLHPTNAQKADEVLQQHVGTMITPPMSVERLNELNADLEHHTLTVEGDGWKQAAADISLSGLGWVAVTGPGRAQVKVTVPKGLHVTMRPPLMPMDVWQTTAKYTGGRAVRKSSRRKNSRKKRHPGVGRN